MVHATFRKILPKSSELGLLPFPELRSQGIGKEAEREKKAFGLKGFCVFGSFLSAFLHRPQKTAPSISLLTCVPGEFCLSPSLPRTFIPGSWGCALGSRNATPFPVVVKTAGEIPHHIFIPQLLSELAYLWARGWIRTWKPHFSLGGLCRAGSAPSMAPRLAACSMPSCSGTGADGDPGFGWRNSSAGISKEDAGKLFSSCSTAYCLPHMCSVRDVYKSLSPAWGQMQTLGQPWPPQ